MRIVQMRKEMMPGKGRTLEVSMGQVLLNSQLETQDPPESVYSERQEEQTVPEQLSQPEGH